ncbi:hypothetical protein ACLOJK_004805 [Asimina triloba]
MESGFVWNLGVLEWGPPCFDWAGADQGKLRSDLLRGEDDGLCVHGAWPNWNGDADAARSAIGCSDLRLDGAGPSSTAVDADGGLDDSGIRLARLRPCAAA